MLKITKIMAEYPEVTVEEAILRMSGSDCSR
jgi:hypothetical protein